jgi:hypothetical protein
VDQDQHQQGHGGHGGRDPSAADGTGTRTDGTQIAFTEARMKTVLSAIWTQGGKPNMVMTGAFNKQAVLDLHRPLNPDGGGEVPQDRCGGRCLRVRLRQAEGRPEPQPAPRDVLVLETAKWAVGICRVRPWWRRISPRSATPTRGSMVSEYVLEARNEKASGGVFDNTTS